MKIEIIAGTLIMLGILVTIIKFLVSSKNLKKYNEEQKKVQMKTLFYIILISCAFIIGLFGTLIKNNIRF